MTTVVACDFDFHETKHVSHYTYAIARVILNTSVQIVITLYSDVDSRWGKNIILVLQGEDYYKWTDDSYITEVVAKKVAEYMPPPPTPVVVEEEVKEEVLPTITEEVVEEVKEECPREEESKVEKKVVAKKRCSKKATPIVAEKTPVAVW
jgi:hypothetical protein